MKIFWLILISMVAITSCYAEVLHVPQECNSIQDAIQSALPYDTILVSPGTYYENLYITGYPVVIASQYILEQDESFIDSTIIDGRRRRSVINFTDCTQSGFAVIGFTIRNGFTDYGGGIYIRRSSPVLKHLKIRDCVSQEAGGGLYVTTESEPSMSDMEISHCNSWHGGGLAVYGNSLVRMEHSNLHDIDSVHAGAAIHVARSQLSLKNVHIYDNFSTPNGLGGALWASLGAVVEMDSVVMTGNRTDVSGDAIYMEYADVTINNSIISGNGEFGSLCTIICLTQSRLNITRTLITENYIELYPLSAGIIYAVDSSEVNINFTTISGNRLPAATGLFYFIDAKLTLTNSILWGNERGLIYFKSEHDTTKLHVSYTDMFGGLDSIAAIPEAIQWGEGNINLRPQFYDPDNGDFRLSLNSPCIDAGDPAGSRDPDGTRADMGAYWFDPKNFDGIPASILPDKFPLISIYPNPFNTTTTIEYRVGANSNSPVTLSLYDLSGRLVQTMVEGRLTPGNCRTTLNAGGLASGVYVVRMEAVPPQPPLERGVYNRKVVVVK